MELRHVVRAEVARAAWRIHGEPQRMRAAHVAQPSFNHLTVSEQDEGLSLVHSLLRVARQRSDDELDGGHLVSRKLAILTVDAEDETARSHVDQLAARALAVLEGTGSCLLCSDR